MSSKKLVLKTSVAIFLSFILTKKVFFQFLTVHRVWGVGIPEPDVGLRYIFLCATRTPAPQIWFRTHLHTLHNFKVIAPADKFALFIICIRNFLTFQPIPPPTPPNSEIICFQNVGTKVVCAIFFNEKKTMLKI